MHVVYIILNGHYFLIDFMDLPTRMLETMLPKALQ